MQNIWIPPTICYSGCVSSEWGGIQKTAILWAKIRIKCLFLTQEHMDLLKQYGYWDNILNNRKQLIDEAASKHKGNGKKE